MRAHLAAALFLEYNPIEQAFFKLKGNHGDHKRSTAHDQRFGCRGLLRTLRLPDGGPNAMTNARALVCRSGICRLGTIQIGALGPINTLPFDPKSGSPES